MAPVRKRKLETAVDPSPGANAGYCWKKADGAPLARLDLQHDLLSYLFTSTAFQFTPPTYPAATTALFPTDRTWSFAELYLDCLSNSSKANKNLKDKMSESTVFAIAFAKMCLLINAGRINTTLAFYPEMKTVLRTYHPIPSMQLDEYTRKNLQDAPRMKAQLKGCAMPLEAASLPENLAEVIRRGNENHWKPPTCVVQLIFLFFIEHARITEKYFPEGLTLHDLFLPPADSQHGLGSEQRAYAFLWLLHRFLETPNLIVQDFSNGDEKLPADQLLKLDIVDVSTENQETPEELAFAAEMKKTRDMHLRAWRLLEENPGAAAESDASAPGRSAQTPEIGQTASGSYASNDRLGTPTAAHRQHSPAAMMQRASSNTPGPSSFTPQASRTRGATPSSTAGPPITGVSASIPPRPSSLIDSVTGQKPQPQLAEPLSSRTMDRLNATNSAIPSTAVATRAAEPISSRNHVLDGSSLQTQEDEQLGLLRAQWQEYVASAIKPNSSTSLLKLAWSRLLRDHEAKRDPCYDSDEEGDWTCSEMHVRLRGFTFSSRNGHGQSPGRKTVLYKSAQPLDSEAFALFTHQRREEATRGDLASPGPRPSPMNEAAKRDEAAGPAPHVVTEASEVL